MQHGWWSWPVTVTWAVVVVAVVLVGFVVVAIAADVPGVGRSWPGQGFVALVAVGFVGLACLVGAVRGQARRDQGQHR